MNLLDTYDLVVKNDNLSMNPARKGRTMGENRFSLQTVFTSTRYVLAFLAASGLFLAFAMRVVLSVALVDMVVDTGSEDNVTYNDNCPVNLRNETRDQMQG